MAHMCERGLAAKSPGSHTDDCRQPVQMSGSVSMLSTPFAVSQLCAWQLLCSARKSRWCGAYQSASMPIESLCSHAYAPPLLLDQDRAFADELPLSWVPCGNLGTLMLGHPAWYGKRG